jgi:hypothetical protein
MARVVVFVRSAAEPLSAGPTTPLPRLIPRILCIGGHAVEHEQIERTICFISLDQRNLDVVNLIRFSSFSNQDLAVEPLIPFPIRLQIAPRWT